MLEAPKPHNEAARMAAVHALQLLGTPHEERFERITRLATRSIGLPIALVNLIDDERLWVKSCQGLQIQESPRSTSFCAHAILAPEVPLVVPDMLSDARFANNPLVINPPNIRFYAGQPLVVNGQAVGTLCLMGHTPRDFDLTDRQALKDLAELAVEELKTIRLGEALAALGRSEERYRLLAEHAHDIIAQHAVDGTFQYVSPACGTLLGYSQAELLGKSMLDYVHPEDRAILQRGSRRILSGERVNERLIYRVVKADGSYVWLESSIQPTRDETTGEVVTIIAVSRDVSLRVAMEEHLRESETRFRALSESAFEAIAISVEGRIAQVNAAFEALFDLPASQAIGLDDLAVVEPAAREAYERQRHRQLGEVIEVRLVRADGQAFDAEVIHRAITWQGQPARVAAVRDITERKAIERLKHEFLGVVSHDLKNPLGSLRLSLDFLLEDLEGELPTEAVEVLDVAKRSVNRLLRLTDDLLDDERLKTGQARLQRRWCHTQSLIAEAAGAVRGQAEAAGVRLELGDHPLDAWADPDRIEQVLVNLAGNAIKFSPRGGVVRIAAASSEDGVLFEVADEGRGIPEVRQAAIFERFEQVEATDATALGGHGLGLAICRAIVEQHGGRIWVDSAPGQGSSFFFSLPNGPR